MVTGLAYLLTVHEPHGCARPLGVYLSAESALASADRWRRRYRLDWARPWVWFRERAGRAEVSVARAASRPDKRVGRWSRKEIFTVSQIKVRP